MPDTFRLRWHCQAPGSHAADCPTVAAIKDVWIFRLDYHKVWTWGVTFLNGNEVPAWGWFDGRVAAREAAEAYLLARVGKEIKAEWLWIEGERKQVLVGTGQ